MTDTAVSIRHAVKIYANGFKALDDVSFEVKQGEFFALLGHNGAGKTTLISAMAGLVELTQGEISVCGFDVKKSPFDVRRNLGVVPQELVFDPFFTVREALKFQSGYFGIAKNDDWIDEILHHLGLTDKAQVNSRNLSGGMKRRLMVALALVHKPPVIVLDEPTAGVDVELRQNLWAFIRRLNQDGHTVILTTHYLEEAQNLCSRIAMMKNGKLVALDDTAKLLHDDNGITAKFTLFRLPEILEKYKIDNKNNEFILHFNNYNQLTDALNLLRQENIAIENMQLLETDLETVFVRLMNDEKEN
ncbi:MAG: ABC transporter ATP-binding protein [Neisseriaceae bacterium]|nr:ABC transporter ATP-binding protein [Neisseriaceae bacterium]